MPDVLPAHPTPLDELERRVVQRGTARRQRTTRRVRAVGTLAALVWAVGIVVAIAPGGPDDTKLVTDASSTTTLAPVSTTDTLVVVGPDPSLPPVPVPSSDPTSPGEPSDDPGISASVPTTATRAHSRPVAFEHIAGAGQWRFSIAVRYPGDATGRVVMPAAGANHRGPSVSPDGRRIAFDSSRDNPLFLLRSVYDIYVMDIDGTNVRRLTTAPLSANGRGAGFPDWSPDGTQIAYIQGDAQNHPELWTMQTDGSGKRRVVRPPMSSFFHPRWSPDGSRLSVLSVNGPAVEVWVVNADGSELRLVTSGPALIADWATDAQLLVSQVRSGARVTTLLDPDSGVESPLPPIGPDTISWFPCGTDQMIGVEDADGPGGDPEAPPAANSPSRLLLAGYDGSPPTVIDTAPAGTSINSPSCAEP